MSISTLVSLQHILLNKNVFYYKLFYFFNFVPKIIKKSIKYFPTKLIVIVNSSCITLWNVDDSWGLVDCLRKNPTILGTKKSFYRLCIMDMIENHHTILTKEYFPYNYCVGSI